MPVIQMTILVLWSQIQAHELYCVVVQLYINKEQMQLRDTDIKQRQNIPTGITKNRCYTSITVTGFREEE